MTIKYKLTRDDDSGLFRLAGSGDAVFVQADAAECVRELQSYWRHGVSDYVKSALAMGAQTAELCVRGVTWYKPDPSAIWDILTPLIEFHRTVEYAEGDRCCVGDRYIHSIKQACCVRLPTEDEANAFFAAAVQIGLHGTRKGRWVHVQTVPLNAGLADEYELPVSRLTVRRPHAWKRAVAAATALTGMRYKRREEGFTGCGGTPGTDDPVSTGVVYIPEGGISWLLHEVGHWVAATEDERRYPNYGLGHEEHGLNAEREWQAHAFESIVLSPFGNSRELTPPAEMTGVAFAKAGPIDSHYYRHIERRIDESLRIREWIDEFRWIYADAALM